MSKAVALIAVIVAMTLNTVGNFYFTYGIWPQSWFSFVFFFVFGLVLFFVMDAIRKE